MNPIHKSPRLKLAPQDLTLWAANFTYTYLYRTYGDPALWRGFITAAYRKERWHRRHIPKLP